MKKSRRILMMVATGFFCSGQSSTDSVGTVDSVKAIDVVPREPNGPTKAGLAKAIETGTIYNSTSPYHNDLHEFTNLVAMRDYCNKTLSQMRDNGESDSYRMNKKLSKKLERELSNAKAELTSSKYNGLKIESGMYEVFLKQINDQFRH
jgi:PBP1b-binding outer membrane lipoprotein LpoB